MATCPNKNLDSWQNLVAVRGEDTAHALWDMYNGVVPESESKESVVKAGLKAINALQTDKAVTLFSTLDRNKVKGDAFWNKIQSDLQIPKEQIELLKQYNTTNREELIANMLGDYSFAIEINIAKDKTRSTQKVINSKEFELGEYTYSNFGLLYGRWTTGKDDVKEITKEEFDNALKQREDLEVTPTQYYFNLTVPGGTNYTENEIATPAITPSIRGHAQFATDKGIGWFRSDDKTNDTFTGETYIDEEYGFDDNQGGQPITKEVEKRVVKEKTPTKTRRILEVQSDLFQKGRDKDQLIGIDFNLQGAGYTFGSRNQYRILDEKGNNILFKDEETGELYEKPKEWLIEQNKKAQINKSENKFLQLLNKGSNWVTFFVKSIIQDSVKKGYEKVLFPSGNTASKVEGHETLEQFKKQKENRIKELEKRVEGAKWLIKNRQVTGFDKNSQEIVNKSFSFLKDKNLSDIVYKTKKEEIDSELNKVVISGENEINQLKQELERIDREGFGALRPIYNFYETTVANILKKQGYSPKVVTDEYGNTWNEVSLDKERDREKILFQIEGETQSSKASSQTVALVKDFLKRIGVDIKKVNEISVDGKKMDANGAALIMQKLIQVVEGKEAEALPEEAMHFAVEMIEQLNPRLFEKLLKEVNSYELLNSIIRDYGKLEEYQTPDGKPDIRKLKKEAIAKILTETVINKNEGYTEKPELLARALTWWQQIIEALKSIFSTSGFDQAAMLVLKGEFLGTVDDIRLENEVYLQSQLTPQQKIVNKLREMSSMISKPVGKNDKYKINGKPIKYRVTDISKSWLENRFSDKQLTNDAFDKAVNDLLAEKGTMLHNAIDWMLKNHLLDSEGMFIKDVSMRPSDDSYVSQLSPSEKSFYKDLKKSMENRLASFPYNTVFLSETTVYDPKRDLAGTIDFIAVEPSGKTHILDWKFTRITNIELQDDIPWYNVMSWKTQMKNYKGILTRAYNVQFDGTEQTRMIPVRAIYSKMDKKKGILPQLIDIELGQIDPKKEERAYLVPVGLEEEKVGERRIDDLIEELNKVYEMLSEKAVTPEKKKEKAEQLNALYKAIRQLKMRSNLKPLIEQAGIINNAIENLILEYENNWKGKDFSEFTKDEREEFASRIMTYEDSLFVYAKIYKNLRPLFQKELSEEDKALKEELRDVSEEAGELQIRLNEMREDFSENIVAKSVKIYEYLKPDKIIKGFSKWFGTTSTLQNKSIQVLYRMANNAFAVAAMETQEEGQRLIDLKNKMDQWAKAKGISGRNYIDIIRKRPGYNKEAVEEKRKEALADLELKKNFYTESEYNSEKKRLNQKYDDELKGKNELIDEYNPSFYSTLRKKSKDKDSDWIIDNINVDAYKQHIAKKKEEEITRAKNKVRYGSEFARNRQLTDELSKIDLLYDVSSKEGLGWLLYDETKKFPKESWKSKEWLELYKKDSSGKYVNAPAVELYEYIKERNEMFEEIGYINSEQKRTFLPFVRKSLVESIFMGGDVKLFEGALRSISVSENDIAFGQIDPINKQPVHTIPKYFTKDTGEEMSDDIFKNLTLINETAIRYKYLKEVENQLRLITKTESNKRAIKTSYFGKTKINEYGEPELTTDNTENTQLLRDMMEAIVYGNKFVESQNFDQLLGGLGNFGKKLNDKLGISIFPEDYSNSQISLNKSLNWLNNAFQLKALGLNPISSIATLLGGTFQSTINAGKYFTKSEFLKNEFLIAARLNGTDAKKYIGALKYFLPLTENYNRELAKKLSLSKLTGEGVQDFLMSLMKASDQYVQTVNFFSYLDNTIVIDGSLVNAREYLKSTPEYANLFTATGEQRKQLQKSFEEDVKKLVAEKGVMNLAEVEGENFVIPGVDRKSESVIELRRKVQSITKDALGNLSEDDVRNINLTIYGKSFMTFKNWIPRLVDVRFGNMKYNAASDAYEWGRTRMMMRWLKDEKLRALRALKSAMMGNSDEWVEQMKKLYERKKSDYEKDTGKTLRMTEEEFVELAAQNIKNQMVDFLFYLTLTAIFLSAKGLKDDDDEDKALRNRYNFMLRVIDKVRDEVAYFYNPAELISLSKSGLIPSIALISDYATLFTNFVTEMYALSVGDDETVEKTYVIKYGLKGLPITSQFDTILLLFFPDLAKDLGMKSQARSRPIGL